MPTLKRQKKDGSWEYVQVVGTELIEDFNNHKADKVKHIEGLERSNWNKSIADIENIEKQLSNYNSYSSEKDDNGILTVVKYKRADDTLYMKSTLSNPDINGKYNTMTWEMYDDLGAGVEQTIVWDIAYDEDGDIVSKEVVKI